MVNRKTSRVAFAYAVATAVTVTCVVLGSLTADWSRFQTLLLLIGCLLVVWAIIFSCLEVLRIATRSKSILGREEVDDPDAPRCVIMLPPTDEATPHHEAHVGSAGLDQGQLTSRLPDHTPSIRELLHRQLKKDAG
jgi:hypothetical protein